MLLVLGAKCILDVTEGGDSPGSLTAKCLGIFAFVVDVVLIAHINVVSVVFADDVLLKLTAVC